MFRADGFAADAANDVEMFWSYLFDFQFGHLANETLLLGLGRQQFEKESEGFYCDCMPLASLI